MKTKLLALFTSLLLCAFVSPVAEAGNRNRGNNPGPHISNGSRGQHHGFRHRGHGHRGYGHRGYCHRGSWANFYFGGYYHGYYPYSFGAYRYYPYDYGYEPVSYVYDGRVVANGRNGSLVGQVQTQLSNAGFYHGAIDGIMGSGTRRALRAFERANGLPVDGVLDQRTLSRMGLA